MDQVSTVVSSVPGYAAEPLRSRAADRAGSAVRSAGAESPRESDRVEISERARELGSNSVIFDSSVIRRDLVDRIRTQIGDDSYVTDEKLDVAADRLARALDLEA